MSFPKVEGLKKLSKLTFRKRPNLARYVSDLIEEIKFSFVEVFGPTRQRVDDCIDERVKNIIECDILHLFILVHVHVGLHVPYQLMSYQLRLLGDVFYQFDYVTHLENFSQRIIRYWSSKFLGTHRVMANSLNQLRNVE